MVQGVGFRFFTRDEAERLRLSGYVRNLRDGRVEVYAIGAPEQLEVLREALECGPRGAMVAQVTEEPAQADPQYARGFDITYDR
jgi:acylphosphatase